MLAHVCALCLTPNLTPAPMQGGASAGRSALTFRSECIVMQVRADAGSILKTAEAARLPWVRIPAPPQL